MSHIGIASSRVRTSPAMLDTCPLYRVVHPDRASSEIMMDVFEGMGSEGASMEDGGLIGPESNA